MQKGKNSIIPAKTLSAVYYQFPFTVLSVTFCVRVCQPTLSLEPQEHHNGKERHHNNMTESACDLNYYLEGFQKAQTIRHESQCPIPKATCCQTKSRTYKKKKKQNQNVLFKKRVI